ncbi:MAG: right-handed parallel beta-helix repeat-containing protein [Verrucomicrobia bacterium]|nr:right-handed parallel beta-helix repeat-containing protein [Verrucomicrobiota bacterium]
MFRFVIFAAVLPLSTFADTLKEEENCPKGKRPYRAGVRHIESGGIGYKDGYTTLEGFFAPDPSQWKVTPFLDVRGHIFDNGKWAANAGAGLRVLWGNRAYGINSYYDYRNTNRFHSNQIGIGLETLGQLFDLRINGYLPVGAKTSSPYDATFARFSGNYMLVSEKIQSAMKGADAELGFHFGKFESFDFYAAAGPYYFIGKHDPATWGGKARISCTFKDILTLEISDSYDGTFHNKFQGQIALSFPFGPKSKVKKAGRPCNVASRLNARMLQPVGRQEIIVINHARKQTVAIDPATGKPYFFVFVDNTSHSNGTYASPYHTLVQAQDNSSPNDIIYVFPGDGSTTGMDSGIFLKANQKFWGSGITHSIQTSQGTISIPAQSSSSPTITNTNIDTDGNAITLASNNAISGIHITSAMNDAIYGTDPQNLEVSSCTIENSTTYVIEASFSGDATISITNNQFLDNVNGVFLTLHGTSSLVCSNNTFSGQTSISSVPLEVAASQNVLTSLIENNVFNDNTTGGIRFALDQVVDADIRLLSNTISNSGTGSQASLGSSCVAISTGTNEHCAITLEGNSFTGNDGNTLYLHTSGAIHTLEVTAATNTMSDNGGSALVLATPVDTLTLLATDNTITGIGDNGIAVISSSLTTTGNITISDNVITDVVNASNGIAVNQDFSTLELTLLDNEIARCEGTGILSYAPTGIDSLTCTISGNTIGQCQNLSSNAAAGLDIEQFTNLVGPVTDNTLSNNTGLAFMIGSTLPSPTACLTLTGNDNDGDYLLVNPVDGLFNLSPCDVDSVNIGTINTSGVITPVQSCPGATPCPP